MLARLTTSLFDESLVVTLGDDGRWSCPSHPELARSLDVTCAPGDFGPADGDPVRRAANRAADLLGGTVEVADAAPADPAAVH